jgi:VacB/RNase II family 3'-5' exoribonuclease
MSSPNSAKKGTTPNKKSHQQHQQHARNSGNSAKPASSPARRAVFAPHRAEASLRRTNLRGVLRIQQRDLAFVSVGGLLVDLVVDGKEARNRAFDGDSVAVELVDDVDVWRTLPNHVTAHRGDDDDDADDADDFRPSAAAAKSFDVAAVAAKLGSQVAALSLADAEVSSDDDEQADEAAPKQPVPTKKPLAASNEQLARLLDDDGVDARDNLVKFLNHAVNARGERLQATARVVFIEVKERAIGTTVVGYLRTRKNDLDVDPNDQFYLFVPCDQKLPTMLVLGASAPREFKQEPQKFLARICAVDMIDWKETSMQPLARFREVVGEAFDIKAETRALLMQYQVADRPHSAEAIACLPQVEHDWQPPAELLAGRRDYRQHRVVTIDPATARDLDDALHIERLPNGNFEMGVHIADVTAFLPANNALDQEASRRATSVYLNDRVIPMLPRLLSDNLCSLHPNVDRLTFSVVWEMTADGTIVGEWFGHTVIRSCSKMAYGVAQAMIDGQLKQALSDAFTADELQQFPAVGPYDGHTVAQVVADVLAMNAIAVQLRKRRFDGGALALHNVKLSFKCDERNVPQSAAPYELKDANFMIEEFMLLANHRVALKLVAALPKASLLRNHVPPVPRKLDQFRAFVETATGVELGVDSSLALNRSLERLKGAVAPDVFTALQDLGTRSMQLAKYFSTGDLPTSLWAHYGLAMGHYTHFTSPIRRYADVLVHRELNWALALDAEHGDFEAAKLNHERTFHELVSSDTLQLLAEHSNVRKLASRKVQEGQAVLLLCLMLRDKPAVCTGVVTGLGDRFVSVFIGRFGVTEKIYMQDLPNLNGWLFSEPSDGAAPADGFAPGGRAALTLQWATAYDPAAVSFKDKEALAAAADEDGSAAAAELEAAESRANDDESADARMEQIARRATALADEDERNARLQDQHAHAANRRQRQRAPAARGPSGKAFDGGDANAADDAARQGHRPSSLPSIEQRLQALDTITLVLGMRVDVKRASLRATALHPLHPDFHSIVHVNAKLTNEVELDV